MRSATEDQGMDGTATAAPPLDVCIERALVVLDVLPDKTRRTLARHLRRSGRLAEAQTVLSVVEREEGPSAFLVDEGATLLEAEDRWVEARALREHRLRQFPDVDARAHLANHLLARPEPEAIQRLGPLIAEIRQLDGGTLATALLLGAALLETGDYAEADRLLTQARADHSRSALVPMLLADVAIARGDPDAARGFVEQAVAIKPRLAEANRERLLSLAVQTGGDEFAADCAEAVPPIAPFSHTELHRELAAALDLGDVPGPPPKPRSFASDAVATPGASQASERVAPPSRHEVVAPDDLVPPVDQEVGEAQPVEIVAPEVEVGPEVLATLREVFGYESLRPGQSDVIQHLIDGVDAIAIMPTGAGKSLTFQLPALLVEGLTVVISPLIALMHDQVASMPPELARQATYINGSLEPSEMDRRLSRMAAGDYKLVYVAPERLRHPAFLEALRAGDCSRVVIDEAHCISMWGHDFRPDYLYIPHALRLLGDPPVLAATATATPETALDISKLLGRSLEKIRTSAYRPNLRYEVVATSGPKEKTAYLRQILRERPGPAIVYVPTRAATEEVAERLQASGVVALPYHAGMASGARTANQERFMRDECAVIVATVAFGMGIDKANVRTIVHYAPPKSLDAYVQEAGRAGRDGLPSACILLWSKIDFVRLRNHAKGAEDEHTRQREHESKLRLLREVYAALSRAKVGRWSIFDRGVLAEFEGGILDPMVAVGLLEQASLVKRHPDTPTSFLVRWTERSALSDPTDGSPFERWLDRYANGSAAITVPTATVCDELGMAPVELEHRLRTRTGLRISGQGNSVCVEMLPSDRTTPQRVERVLHRLTAAANRAVTEIDRYVMGTSCRHVALAAHLGERIERCHTACDICAPRGERRVLPPSDGHRSSPAGRPTASGGRPVASQTTFGSSGTSRTGDVPATPVELGIDANDPTFLALKRWRLAAAKERGWSPGIIAKDIQLAEIVRTRPTHPDELARIPGFGAKKAETHGAAILAVLAEHDR